MTEVMPSRWFMQDIVSNLSITYVEVCDRAGSVCRRSFAALFASRL